MTTLKEYFERNSAYWGENGDWIVAETIHRDAEIVSRCNWESWQEVLKEVDPEGANWSIERSSHWAVGWVDYLIVNPEWEAGIKVVEETQERIQDYPVLDEFKLSDMETEEADETWQNCYDSDERIKYIRNHRYQFEFRDFADLMGCVRGQYFAGYASELIA